MNNLSYAAAYHPYLNTTLNYTYDEDKVSVTGLTATPTVPPPTPSPGDWSAEAYGITFSYNGTADSPKVVITADAQEPRVNLTRAMQGPLALSFRLQLRPRRMIW